MLLAALPKARDWQIARPYAFPVGAIYSSVPAAETASTLSETSCDSPPPSTASSLDMSGPVLVALNGPGTNGPTHDPIPMQPQPTPAGAGRAIQDETDTSHATTPRAGPPPEPVLENGGPGSGVHGHASNLGPRGRMPAAWGASGHQGNGPTSMDTTGSRSSHGAPHASGNAGQTSGRSTSGPLRPVAGQLLGSSSASAPQPSTGGNIGGSGAGVRGASRLTGGGEGSSRAGSQPMSPGHKEGSGANATGPAAGAGGLRTGRTSSMPQPGSPLR